MLASVEKSTSERPAVNLVLPALSAGGLFAGVRTAVEVGVSVSRALDRKLRVISFAGPHTRSDYLAVERLLTEDFHISRANWEIVAAADVDAIKTQDDDVWIATYWTTAHALDVRSRLGLLDPNKVIYLIQDYEPSFLPASTDGAIAASTYRAGFVPLVNSAPLASALERNAGLRVDTHQVFAPQLDLVRLHQVSTERHTANSSPEILFYGRPSKPRNMFNLGVAALRRVVQSADRSSGWTFSSVGEKHRPVALGGGVHIRSLGSLSWSGYFERIAKAQIMFSLQASPHPSHPPLDMVVSGGLAVTNEVDDTRADLHGLLAVAAADPDALAAKVELQMKSALNSDLTHEFDSAFVSKLGVPLNEALLVVAKMVSAG
jgi:hypothetical protein